MPLLGLQIEGDVIKAHHMAPQRPIEEFAPILQAILDDPTIAAVGWTQYTPYFNDGDACVFHVHDDVKVLMAGEVQGEDVINVGGIYDEFLEFDYETGDVLGTKGHVYNKNLNKWEEQPYKGPDEARWNRVEALRAALGGGAFNEVLYDLFGDHARIDVYKDRIAVEFVEHD